MRSALRHASVRRESPRSKFPAERTILPRDVPPQLSLIKRRSESNGYMGLAEGAQTLGPSSHQFQPSTIISGTNISRAPQTCSEIAGRRRGHKFRDLRAQLGQIDYKFVPPNLNPSPHRGVLTLPSLSQEKTCFKATGQEEGARILEPSGTMSTN